jgi:archaellum biogenesis ATPase FlaH
MEHIPKPRELKKQFQKTLILVGGEGLQGKTTLCAKLLKDDVGYISFDEMTWENDLGIEDIVKMKSLSEYPHRIPQALNHIIPKYNIFLEYTIKKINSIDKDIILIDSFYFTNAEFHNRIVIDLTNQFRVWEMKKLHT